MISDGRVFEIGSVDGKTYSIDSFRLKSPDCFDGLKSVIVNDALLD